MKTKLLLRSAVLAGLIMVLVGIGWSTGTVRGQGGPIAPGGPDLQTTLQTGLKARRPQEFAFIAQVVELVDAGTLPSSIVISSFLWARRHKPYPFPFFEFALRSQATSLGIPL